MDLADGAAPGRRAQRRGRRPHPRGHHRAGGLRRHLRAEREPSGVVPQISAILGPCAGGAAYSPALTDFVFTVKDKTNLFVTGPDVVEAVTGEATTHEELGGALTHATRTGVASFLLDDEASASRRSTTYCHSCRPTTRRIRRTWCQPTSAVAAVTSCWISSRRTPNRTYDVRDVIEVIVDDGDYLEVQSLWATNIVCTFARLDGHVVGIVANQPLVLAGALNIDAAEKAARFVRTCDAFNIPLVTLVDVPGFLPGVDQEHAGIIRRGAKLLYAFCESTVPRVQVVRGRRTAAPTSSWTRSTSAGTSTSPGRPRRSP